MGFYSDWQRIKQNGQGNSGAKTSQNGNGANGGQTPPTLDNILSEFRDCSDLIHKTFPQTQTDVLYFHHLVEKAELDRAVLLPLQNANNSSAIGNLLLQPQFVEETDAKQCIKAILNGSAAVFHQNKTYSVNVTRKERRGVRESETESVITGPHEAFIEDISTNLSLVRKRVKSSHLKTIHLEVGEIAKNDVCVMFIQDIANQELVNTILQRIKGIETDIGLENNMLVQAIEENPYSVFPQFITTERPDVVASKLTEGKVVILLDGSPSAICAPTSFFEFFSSPDDYYQRWPIGSSLRLLRLVAFAVTLIFTACYVSLTTFHYEMIPQTLLLSLAESRARVPFPPLLEALLMEMMIELLREAGARLPSKVGQTIGIVGGIVIGQAAVQAGLTSNILIIAVASSAIASFVIPSYIMSASLRLLRFVLIILSGVWGILGLVIGIGMIVIHMSGITNLGTSYLTPLAPMRLADWKDTFVRAPLAALESRPDQSRSENNAKNRLRK